MTKHKTYCYVRERDLKKNKVRIYFEYDNTEVDNRVCVERSEDYGYDSQALAKKVAERLKRRVRVVCETETIYYNINQHLLKRYYLTLHENTNKESQPKTLEVAEC